MTTENVDELADSLFEEVDVLLDDFHAHEALDRMFVVTDMFNSYVFEHPYISQNETLTQKAEELSDLLYDFYKEIALDILANEDKSQQ